MILLGKLEIFNLHDALLSADVRNDSYVDGANTKLGRARLCDDKGSRLKDALFHGSWTGTFVRVRVYYVWQLK